MIKANLRKFSMVVLALVMAVSFGIGISAFSTVKTADAAATTTADTAGISGKVTFENVGSLSTQTTYWYNGVKFYSYNSQNLSTGGDRWTSAITTPNYVADVTAGEKWGSYTMSGLILQQHALAVSVASEGTLKVVFDCNTKSESTAFSNLKACWDSVAYADSYTTSTYKNSGSSSIDLSSYATQTDSSMGQYTVEIPVTAADIAAGKNVIRFYYGSSGSGAGKVFLYESIELVKDTRTISYDANGGTNAPDEQKLELTVNSLTVGAAPTAPSGRQFVGWNYNGTTYQPNATIDLTNISGNIAFTAVYNTYVTAIAEPSAIVKVYAEGLDVAALSLPQTVSVTTVDGTKEMSVSWNTTSLVLDGSVQTAQTIQGTVTLDSGYVLSDGVSSNVSIDVTIVASAPEISVIEKPADIKVIALTSEVTLPSSVNATVNGQQVSLPVTWDTTSLNLNVPATYNLVGTVDAGEYVLPETVTVTQTVVVYADAVLRAEEWTITVAQDVKVELPSTVKVTLKNSLTNETYAKDVKVTWQEAADTSELGSQTILGTLNLDASMSNESNIQARAIITIINQTVVEWSATDDPSDDNYGVSWTTIYTDNILGSKNGVIVKVETGCTSDGDSNVTKSEIKIAKGTSRAISITIPEKATQATIEVDVAAYSSSKTATLTITNEQGTVVATVAIDGTDCNSMTVVTATAELTEGGTYYINETNNKNNIYITAITVKAIVPELNVLMFDANGGSNAPRTVEQESGTSYVIIDGATPPAGYEFVEWNTDSEGEGQSFKLGSSFTLEEKTTTLYAIYKKQITSVEKNVLPDVIMLKADVDSELESGTTLAELYGLVSSVDATLGGDEEVTLEVSWNLTDSMSAVGNYQLVGTINSDGYNFASGVSSQITLSVTILAEKIKITAITTATLDVELGSTGVLPETVSATLSNGTTANIEVSFEDAQINWTALGTNTYDGVLSFDERAMELADGVKAQLQVVVYNYTITSIAPVADTTVYVGSTVGLPTSVTATYVDHSGVQKTVQLAVTWDSSKIDFANAGNYEAVGTVQFTALYVKAESLSDVVSAKIVVADYVAASTARSTYFTNSNALTSAGTVRGISISGASLSYDSISQLYGQKIKNGSVSFTLTSAAKVTIVYAVADSKVSATMTFDGVSIDDGTTGIKVISRTLEAGTHTLAATSTSGSFSVAYVLIDDGGSEIFVADKNVYTSQTTVTLPSVSPFKTVDGVQYTFYGYTTAEGTAIYAAGDSVEIGDSITPYYALYLNPSMVNGAAIKVSETEKVMRFTASLGALNGEVYLENLMTNGKLAFATAITLSGANASDSVTVSKVLSSDLLTIKSYVAVSSVNAEYTAVTTALIGETNIFEHSVVRSAKWVAEQALADTETTSGTKYKFAVDGVYSCYNTSEREMISTYLEEDEEENQFVEMIPGEVDINYGEVQTTDEEQSVAIVALKQIALLPNKFELDK